MFGKEKRQLLFAYGVFILASLFLLARPIGDMDEIWNYNFGYNICNGLAPYADFNCIVTPLSAYISAGFLWVFGNSLFSFRVLGIILLSSTFCLLFWLLYSCGKSMGLAFATAGVLFALCYIAWMYNYNNLNLLLILLALCLELKIEKSNNQSTVLFHVAVGVVYSAVFLSKQSVGGLLLFANAVFCGVSWFVDRNQRKILGLRLAASLILPAVFAVYLLCTGAFPAFWDYAVKGISTFSHGISYVSFVFMAPINFVIGIFPIVVTSVSLWAIVKGRSRVNRRFHIKALVISWIGMSVVYPLCDLSHMIIAVVPFSVCWVCCLNEGGMPRKVVNICVSFAVFFLSCVCLLEIPSAENYKICKLNRYQGLLIEASAEIRIEAIDRYILEKEAEGYEVLIADSDAALFLLPLDRYYKDFSLLNVGNLGTQTVRELLWREKALYLINRDRTAINPQSHFELIGFIADNYTKTEEVLVFDVYEAK